MSKIRVILDPGHGGRDSGAVKGRRYEKDDALRLARRVGKVLKANGIDVYYTRKNDRYDSVLRKARIGNASGADYFISIHRNAAFSKRANGAEILLYSRRGEKLEIAKSIQRYFVKHGFADRGIRIRKGLAVLRRISMPSLLIEVGFITNDYDNELFDRKFNTIANCIAKGFMDAVGLKFRSLKQISESK